MKQEAKLYGRGAASLFGHGSYSLGSGLAFWSEASASLCLGSDFAGASTILVRGHSVSCTEGLGLGFFTGWQR